MVSPPQPPAQSLALVKCLQMGSAVWRTETRPAPQQCVQPLQEADSAVVHCFSEWQRPEVSVQQKLWPETKKNSQVNSECPGDVNMEKRTKQDKKEKKKKTSMQQQWTLIISWLPGGCPLTWFCSWGKQLPLEEHRPGERARHGATLMESILRGKGQPWRAKDPPSFLCAPPLYPILFTF